MKNANLSGITIARLFKPAVAALLFVSLLSTTPAQATDKKPKEAPVAVKYLGSESGKPLFQISFNNPQGEEIMLTLRDESGYVIYSDVSKEKNYLRNLRFNELDSDKVKLALTIRTKKETKTQSFEITKSTRTIEDVAVVSL